MTVIDAVILRNEYGEKITIRDGQAFHSDAGGAGGCLVRMGYGRDFLGRMEVVLNSREADMIESALPPESVIRFERTILGCGLSGGWCPICWEKTGPAGMNRHHIIWRMEGGRNVYWNLLNICADCHALLTFGSNVGGLRDTTARMFGLSHFGLLLALHDKERRKELWPIIEEHGRWETDRQLKAFAQKLYTLLVFVHRRHLDRKVIRLGANNPDNDLFDTCLDVLSDDGKP